VTIISWVKSFLPSRLFEMANVTGKYTGLPMTIWISPGEGIRHGPRIKVCQLYGVHMSADRLFTVTVGEDPQVIGNTGEIKTKDIAAVLTFVQVNRVILEKLWKLEIEATDAVLAFKKIVNK